MRDVLGSRDDALEDLLHRRAAHVDAVGAVDGRLGERRAVVGPRVGAGGAPDQPAGPQWGCESVPAYLLTATR